MLPAATTASSSLPQELDVLEAVQQREHDRAVERAGLDALERSVEREGLDRDDEERDRPVEPRDDLGVRDGRLSVVDERQPACADRLDRRLRADPERAGARDEHPADPAEAEDGDGHASPGSTTRLTYWVSE